MKTTLKNVAAFALLVYALLFVLVNVDGRSSALAAVASIAIATAVGLGVARKHDAVNAR